MGTFGHCTLEESALATATGYKTFIRVEKGTLSELGTISTVKARINVGKYPISAGDYPFKCVIYSDNNNYPNELKGESDIQTLQDDTPKAWVVFNFSPGIELPAGDYWIGIIRGAGKGNHTDIKLTGGVRCSKSDAGGDYYNNPPATFPAGGNTDDYLMWLCATYSVTTNPYPTSQLKKGLLSGFHCFMSAYILAKLGGYDPLKLPDGTLF